MLYYSLKIPTRSSKCCFSNPAAGQQKLVGSTKQNQFCLLYQILICVAAGEPHPQSHYQMTINDADLKCIIKYLKIDLEI
jgi:hypothetical protein